MEYVLGLVLGDGTFPQEILLMANVVGQIHS